MLYFKERPDGIIFKIHVQPRSSKNMVTGVLGDALKIKLMAPPVDGAANGMCIKYLAKCLSVSVSSLEIISGHTGKTKYIHLKYGGNRLSGKPEDLKSKIKLLIPIK